MRNQQIVLLFLVLTLSSLVLVTCATNVYTGLKIDDVEREVDATKPNLVRHKITLKVVNNGDKAAEQFHLALPKQFALEHLYYLRVDQDKRELKINHYGYEDTKQSDSLFYEVQLEKAIQPKEKIELNLFAVFANRIIVPYPKEIFQNENQLVLYTDNAYFYSPYEVNRQRTTINLGTSIIKSYTDNVKPVDKRGTSVTYGPYSNQKPYAYKAISVHYQNNNPFVVVTKVDRLIEISHWGNIAVEENYDVRHDGARLKGEFSRLDYARNPYMTSPSSFRTLTAKLPPTAADIYYRDRLGNITTSTVRSTAKNIEVDFLPRFPLFGGWRIRFTIGYNLPTHPFLRSSGDKYELKAKFSIPFDFAPVDELTLRVVVPEGANNIKLETPYPVDSETREILKTYLDVSGRTVVVVKKTHLVPEHNQEFILTYNFPSTYILRKPLVVITGLFIFCLFIMVYVRLDFTIEKSPAQLKAEEKERLLDQIENAIEKQVKINKLYSKFEEVVKIMSSSSPPELEEQFNKLLKERETLIQERDAIEGQYKNKLQKIIEADKEKFKTLQELMKIKKSGKGKNNLAGDIQSLEQQYNKNTELVDILLDELLDWYAKEQLEQQ
jgi:oligosaccharyltransferase complex subunit alpha (ribophorin I)